MASIGIEFFQTEMLTRKCAFSINLIVLSSLIPHESILCDHKDPPWFNSWIKTLLQAKNKTFKNYRKNKTNIQKYLIN